MYSLLLGLHLLRTEKKDWEWGEEGAVVAMGEDELE